MCSCRLSSLVLRLPCRVLLRPCPSRGDLSSLPERGLDFQSSDPMLPHLAHGLGRSDDTEAHTSTVPGAAHADGAGAYTT